MTRSEMAEFDRSLRKVLERRKIRYEDTEVCFVEMSAEGIPLYRKRINLKQRVWHRACRLQEAMHGDFRRAFIGYAYENGELRDDAEMLAKPFGGVDLPFAVVFFRHGVRPYAMRDRHGYGRRDQRPMVVVG